ncbi:MAG TPA: LuxR C-terminal-related transcriptional regulator [Anaerolineales bacterium]|nr:LuxR C-terminal-related transcriptional regulator [Anaerolineales bacterium]
MVASAPILAVPILATKLYIPPPPPKLVVRTRLIERLNEALSAGRTPGVTLISAPAGFGKTTLVSEWVHQKDEGGRRKDESKKVAFHPSSLIPHPSRVCWLSLDEGDSDLTRFLTYLVAALQTLAPSGVEGVAPKLGEGALEVLQAAQSQPPPAESILTALLNEIITLPEGFILVLDDYHVIDSRTVDEALTFLVEHLPPQMHLVITTREDPALPIPRLRARRQLIELRAADLRFTPSEAAEFLNQVMDLHLSAEDVAALENRTEGWIAGLQLAALSMRGHQDVAGFIRGFAGDHRYIVDYLVEEVLQRQPEPIRSFLLQTSILDRLSGPLCDAVIGNHPDGTGQPGGKARLETLQRGNFFLLPLDDKRHWYRYHHLFADVLHMHLITEQPDQVPALHRRASEWYEQNGSAADAIRHALAAKDFERAANLIERAVPAMRRSRQESTVLGWLRALPDELFHSRPVLSVHYAGALLLSGNLEGVEPRLRDAERWLDTMADIGERPDASPDASSADMVVVDEEEFRRLPGWIAIYRAASALALDDVHGTVRYARRALDLVLEDDHLGHGAAAGFLGLVYWRSGDLEAAHRSWADGIARLQGAGHISDAIGCAIALADIRITQGRLHDAMRTYEQALKLATEQGTRALRGTADMHVGISDLKREHNDLNAATQHLLRSQELGELAGLRQNRYRWRAAMARIRESQGDLDGALDLLQEAEPLYVSDFFPNVRPVAALKTRVWVAQGRLGEALDWAREQGLFAEGPLSYPREFEHITLARILLARYKSDRTDSSIRVAIGLLERLLQAAEAGGRTGSAIEILILQALAHQALGDIPPALAPLERALTLAEPEGYVRIFLDEGPPMAGLLLETAGRGIMPDYTGKLLEAFNDERHRSEGDSPLPASQPLIEPLSQRELEILRLFKTELSGPEIAHELVIALSTVRTHTKSIYSKLNVNNRRAAVKRAAELNLI